MGTKKNTKPTTETTDFTSEEKTFYNNVIKGLFFKWARSLGKLSEEERKFELEAIEQFADDVKCVKESACYWLYAGFRAGLSEGIHLVHQAQKNNKGA